jgi:hypothetical protein
MDIGTELAELESEMGQAGSRYWREPEWQARYYQLVKSRLAHTSAPAQPSALSVERREIERMMGNASSPYWRGPRADELQQRYRDLLTGEARHAATEQRWQDWAAKPEAQPGDVAGGADADAWRGDLDDMAAALGDPEEWRGLDPDQKEGLTAELHRAQDGGAAILVALGNEDAAEDLAANFEELPAGAMAAALAALAKFEPGYSQNADTGELAAFRADQSCGGRELVAHWGSAAPRRLGIAMTSFNEARGLMGDADRAAFDDWWRATITPRERQLILWRLGEPK